MEAYLKELSAELERKHNAYMKMSTEEKEAYDKENEIEYENARDRAGALE